MDDAIPSPPSITASEISLSTVSTLRGFGFFRLKITCVFSDVQNKVMVHNHANRKCKREIVKVGGDVRKILAATDGSLYIVTTELYSGDTVKAKYLKTSNQVTAILGLHPGENSHPFREGEMRKFV